MYLYLSLLSFLILLPTSVSCERNFSKLKLIKSFTEKYHEAREIKQPSNPLDRQKSSERNKIR